MPATHTLPTHIAHAHCTHTHTRIAHTHCTQRTLLLLGHTYFNLVSVFAIVDAYTAGGYAGLASLDDGEITVSLHEQKQKQKNAPEWFDSPAHTARKLWRIALRIACTQAIKRLLPRTPSECVDAEVVPFAYSRRQQAVDFSEDAALLVIRTYFRPHSNFG